MLKKVIILSFLLLILVFVLFFTTGEIESIYNIPENGTIQHAKNLGNLIERDFINFRDQFEILINSENIYDYLIKPDQNIETGYKLKLFYEKHHDLIQTIFIYNKEKTLKLFYTEDNHYLVNEAFLENQITLNSIYTKHNNLIQIIEPFKDNNGIVAGNFEVLIDIETFVVNRVKSYNPGNLFWSLLLSNNQIKEFYSDNKTFTDIKKLSISNFGSLQNLLSSRLISLTKAEILYDNDKYIVTGSLYPLQALKLPYSLFIVFPRYYITRHVLRVLVPLISIFLVIIIALFFKLHKKGKDIESLRISQSENFILYKNLYDNCPYGIIEYNIKDLVNDFNEYIKVLLNISCIQEFYTEKETKLINTHFSPIFQNITTDLYKPAIITVLINGKEVYLERVVIEHFYNKNSYLIFIRDISNCVNNQNLINKMKKSKFEFLANISHELKTPITSIVNFTNILADEKLMPDKQPFLEQIIISAKKLIEVVNNILNLSKLELDSVIVDNMPIDVMPLLKPLIDEYTLLCKQKNLYFNFKCEEELPIFLNDPVKIYQVIQNLLSNALKFTLLGGITFRVYKSRNIDSEDIIRFEVSDTGIGIEKSKHKDLFKPFFQADTGITRSYGGAGLGLSISFKLAQLINANIYLFKSDETGSCFIFDLLLKQT